MRAQQPAIHIHLEYNSLRNRILDLIKEKIGICVHDNEKDAVLLKELFVACGREEVLPLIDSDEHVHDGSEIALNRLQSNLATLVAADIADSHTNRRFVSARELTALIDAPELLTHVEKHMIDFESVFPRLLRTHRVDRPRKGEEVTNHPSRLR